MEGLACLEEIDAEAWFAGSKAEAYLHLEAAATLFNEAREKFLRACTECSEYQEWLPADRRGELTPDLDTFRQMAHILGQIIATLREHELPTLGQVHAADELMRTEMIIAERRAVAMRGTAGHFPLGAP